MEQLEKLKNLVKKYSKVVASMQRPTDLQELDSLKVEGARLSIELARQVNRVVPEFQKLAREKRYSLTISHYNKLASTEPTSTAEALKQQNPEEASKGAKAKKSRKAKR